MASDRRLSTIIFGAVMLLASVASVASVARADTTQAAKQSARDLMDRGDLLVEAKSYEEALAAYERAHAIMNVPTTGIEVARTHAALGHVEQARAVALEVARSAKTPGEPAVYDETRAEAAKLAGELADAVEARAHAASTERAISNAATQPPVDRERDHVVMIRGGLVAAGTGVALGTLFGAMSLSRASSAKEVCVGSRCPPSARDDIDAAKTLGTLSNVAFVVGLAGAAVGGYGLWAQGRDRPRVQAVLGPTAIGVAGVF